MPEYGRNVQKMVDHCKTIEDREERNKCARSIIKTMANLSPESKDVEDFDRKLWDHLAIMSDFELDIDYPYEIVAAESINEQPQRLPYQRSQIKYRHYGRCLEDMISQIRGMEDGDKKEALISLIANHMKKLQLAINKDGVDDAKIFSDLAEYSLGEIRLSEDNYHLHDFKVAQQPAAKKKKKK